MEQYLPLLTSFEKAAQDALTEHANDVMDVSDDRFPKDSGDTVKTREVKVEDLTVTAGYTDFVARLQHENLDYEHRNGGRAKFLESAAEEQADQLSPTVEKHLRAVFGG
ncbi:MULTISPECIES: hypothetical protein [unclassified Agrococcus]|uniref:hypothetical protein n=1 Tax=unclassified Agrococcus TaxID=2615065 RepID=UPI00360A9B6F